MKAITAVCATGASVPAIVNGRVARQRTSPTGENAEIKMYLSKLKDLVPFMPKNRKLSKLEIIQHVIDYICDLQSELETSSSVSNFDAAAVLNELQQHDDRITTTSAVTESSLTAPSIATELQTSTNRQLISPNSHHRQPLVDRSSPNLILTTPISAPAPQQQQHQTSDYYYHHQQQQQNHSSSGQFYLNHQSSTHSHTVTEKGNSRI